MILLMLSAQTIVFVTLVFCISLKTLVILCVFSALVAHLISLNLNLLLFNSI
jgi:hypothetical protein